ncbi:hypothetical protein RclHR1_15980002 [Rhizophagus clarus]|uniref:Uncharacterized protein n=1 Tax=Rhizophagus clarus TaxID=94130 RepID=A0A2Z6R974_9GLOM|nr:hypothetical protein RclHR1_15980002 [Rhizophagus clarus]GES78661.1 hypothetical protein GLOIN_2v1476258 [Rhizophagus clarus]
MRGKKKRPFTSFTDLSSVLKKFIIIVTVYSRYFQFTPSSFPFTDDDEELQQCIIEIKRKLCSMGTLIPADNNEAVRNEYISSILHAAINIIRRITSKEISLFPAQLQVMGDENGGRVNYAIMSLEELICITESKQYSVNVGFVQNVIQCESANLSMYLSSMQRCLAN